MKKPTVGEDPQILLKVREALVQQLYKQTWVGLAGVFVITLAVSLTLWQVLPHWKLLLWAGTSVLLTIVRVVLNASFYRQSPKGADIHRWANLHVIGVTASGIMWALPSLFLWPDNSPVHQLVWPICIIALSASAVATYCTWTPSYISFLLLSAVPLSLRLLSEEGLVHIVLGLLGLFFIAVLTQTGKVMHAANLRALVLGIRNETLNSFLSREKMKQENLNQKLQKEITGHKRAQKELHLRNQELETTKINMESTNNELEHALKNIKQLSGMLPICAACKKIRNDNGYWEQIEMYVRNHSDAQFSHGICPDCAVKLYPEFYQDPKNKNPSEQTTEASGENLNPPFKIVL